MQPWASQVNPIPSATVPVIKLRVAADALLSNPGMQRAVFAAHQQQMLSPTSEPAVFNLPMSTVTIIEDLLMAAMALWMLI